MKKCNIILAGAAIALAAQSYARPQQTAGAGPEEAAKAATDSVPGIYDELDELVITAKKEVVKSDGAKLTYDLEQDTSTDGQNLLDALRKVPMVTVDGQDNIYIKGSQNFRIYVNGKEDPMLTANASKVLKAMPAESVSKIEVITEPGAKYDAEGTGGILNLITERVQRKDGYTGSVSLSFSSQNEGVSLYGRMKYDKVTADASLNYFDNYTQGQTNIQDSEEINKGNATDYRKLQQTKQSFRFNYIGASLNLSWEPTDKNLFTIGADINNVSTHNGKIDMRSSMYNTDGALQWSLRQNLRGTLKNLGVSGNASYRRTFSDRDNTLTFAYRFNYSNSPIRLAYENTVESGNYAIMPYQQNNMSDYGREHTVTVDYAQPWKDGKHKLEAGAKGVWRRNTAVNSMSGGMDPDALVTTPDETGTTRQIQDVYALYGLYTGVFGKVSVTGGIRYEHTRMGLDFLDHTSTDFRRNLDDVVPNAAVTYMFGPASNLRLAYQMRISRPSISQVNPTPFRLPSMVMVGNPNLESERHNSISLSYSNYGGVVGGNVSLDLRQANNAIEEYIYLQDDVFYQSYGNFGKNRSAYLSGFLNWNINQKMSVSVNAAVNFTSIRSGDGSQGNHGWNGNYGLQYSYTGPWAMKYSLYGGQSTGSVSLQGKDMGYYYYGLGISRSFLKDDALTVSVNASNFFTKYMRYKMEYSSADFYNLHTFRNRSWNVGINISWNFGHLQDRVKTTGANVENDDQKSSDSGRGKGGIGL